MGGGGYFQSRLLRVAWCFPVKHFNTLVVTLRCEEDRK